MAGGHQGGNHRASQRALRSPRTCSFPPNLFPYARPTRSPALLSYARPTRSPVLTQRSVRCEIPVLSLQSCILVCAPYGILGTDSA
eukprot:1058263-Rhodomonas_salina.1